MKNKYYTPKIEEFGVGFEYEVNGLEGIWDNGDEDREWVHTSIDDNIHQLFSETKRLKEEPQNIRVKYLDKKDIESLGFKKSMTHNNWYDYKNERYWLYKENEKDWRWIISDEESEVSFAGSIKNKSELKKLLKQLNIK